MFFTLTRRLRQIGRKLVCGFAGHRVRTRQRGPMLSHGLDVWCQRDCGFRETIR